MKTDFGCMDCLIIINKDREFKMFDDKLSNWYRDTFDNPEFNPRWECGHTEYLEIMEVRV
jgi:hypothetical protein